MQSRPDRKTVSYRAGDRIFEPVKGRRMREYVRFSEELLADERKRASWILRSLDYAESINPKAARKK